MYRYTATKCHYVLNDMKLDVYIFLFCFLQLVGLLTGLHRSYRMDFPKTLIENGFW